MRFHMTPQDRSFFHLLTQSAQHLIKGAELLVEITEAEPSQRQELAAQLHAIENQTDEATHTIFKRLNQTFVTPIDRDDISTLASGLDDCMDHLDEAGDLIALYKLGELPDRMGDQVEILCRCAELTAQWMPKLKDPSSMIEYCMEINRLENQGDRAYRKLLAELFNSDLDPKTLIKIKDVIEALEAATDCFERLANTIETVAIKES